MIRTRSRARLLAAAVACVTAFVVAGTTAYAARTAAQPATDAQTKAITAAATAFLTSLTAEQCTKVQCAFTHPKTATASRIPHGPNFFFEGEQYGAAMWSNYPVSDVPRPGLTLGSLRDRQRRAALHLVETLLSPAGYQKVLDIMDADQVLSESGTPYDDGVAAYTLGVFGTPSVTASWMLQFGGHHLGTNAVVVGPNVSFAPTLTGVQPATFTRNGETVRPLGRETDKAFRLMSALTTAQRQKAILTYRVEDLVAGPGHDGQVLAPEGLPVAEMTTEQRAMLMDLIGEWIGMLNADDAAPKLARVRADLTRSYFAWYGGSSAPTPIYFRVTGPTLHIEFANQQWGRQGTGSQGPGSQGTGSQGTGQQGPGGGPGGGPRGPGGPQGSGAQGGGVNHIHTVYRNPDNAYGSAWITQPRERERARVSKMPLICGESALPRPVGQGLRPDLTATVAPSAGVERERQELNERDVVARGALRL